MTWADLLLSASEHEGFCVPLVEAFHKGIPVVAFAATAVPDTMDGGGVLYDRKDPGHVASIMHGILSETTLLDEIVRSQDAALARLMQKDFGGTLLGFVDRVRRSPRIDPPLLTPDFWRQYESLEELEELRRHRPAAYLALPKHPKDRRGPGTGDPRRHEAVSGVDMIINQWLAAAHEGDAVGDSARRVRALLRRQGHIAEIFALTIDEPLRGHIREFSDPDTRRGDITILHYAIPSPMSEALTQLPRGRVLHYHNVTPAHFFALYDPLIFKMAATGRHELASLAGQVDLALGVSEYNRQELVALGFDNTDVMPIVVQPRSERAGADRPALERVLNDGLTNILFVGRIAPNKRLEDHLRLAEHYKRYVDPDYRFIFVGRTDAVPRYYAALRALMLEYGMAPDRFLFPGLVSDADLAVYYHSAHAYLSLSEHEGFCVPLIEAMAANVPVLAYGAAAVPETLGGAGVCFTPKDLEWAAEMLGMLVYDEELRTAVIARQRQRAADFGPAAAAKRLDALITRLS